MLKTRERWGNLPSDSDGESNLWLSLNEEVSSLLGLSLGVDESLVGSGVLLEVFLGVGLSCDSGGLSILLSLGSSVLGSLNKLLVSSLLLKNVLWDDFSSIEEESVSHKVVCLLTLLPFVFLNLINNKVKLNSR